MNVHEPPKTIEEIYELLGKVNEQEKEMRDKSAPMIHCDCGRLSSMKHMYHCYHCDLWFCSVCSPEHFGKRPLGLMTKSLCVRESL